MNTPEKDYVFLEKNNYANFVKNCRKGVQQTPPPPQGQPVSVFENPYRCPMGGVIRENPGYRDFKKFFYCRV